jgi:hypothetical protein
MFGALEVNIREDILLNIKIDMQRRRNMFAVVTKSNEAAIHPSFALL